MAQITLGGNAMETVGELPAKGTKAPDFCLVKTDLSETTLQDYAGKTLVLNIFPSVDTGVCAASVRRFNAEASKKEGVIVLCISADLPFAHGRFCEAEGLKNVIPASVFRDHNFGERYGQRIVSGPMTGLLARAVLVIDGTGTVLYGEQVPEIGQEPNYEAALAALA